MDKDARIEELEQEVEHLKRQLAERQFMRLPANRRDLLKSVGVGGAAMAVGGFGYAARGAIDDCPEQNAFCVDSETTIYVQETPPIMPRPGDIWIRTDPTFADTE